MNFRSLCLLFAVSSLSLYVVGCDTREAGTVTDRDSAVADSSVPGSDASADSGNHPGSDASVDDAAVGNDAATGNDAAMGEDASTEMDSAVADASMEADASTGGDAATGEDASMGMDASTGADAATDGGMSGGGDLTDLVGYWHMKVITVNGDTTEDVGNPRVFSTVRIAGTGAVGTISGTTGFIYDNLLVAAPVVAVDVPFELIDGGARVLLNTDVVYVLDLNGGVMTLTRDDADVRDTNAGPGVPSYFEFETQGAPNATLVGQWYVQSLMANGFTINADSCEPVDQDHWGKWHEDLTFDELTALDVTRDEAQYSDDMCTLDMQPGVHMHWSGMADVTAQDAAFYIFDTENNSITGTMQFTYVVQNDSSVVFTRTGCYPAGCENYFPDTLTMAPQGP